MQQGGLGGIQGGIVEAPGGSQQGNDGIDLPLCRREQQREHQHTPHASATMSTTLRGRRSITTPATGASSTTGTTSKNTVAATARLEPVRWYTHTTRAM